MPNPFKTRQGAGVGSAYIAVSFGVSGVLTFAFQGLSTRFLGVQGYAPLALLWSATFLTVQVLWIGATQTLGRYVAEREAQGSDWGPVVSSVRQWQIGLVVAFVLAALIGVLAIRPAQAAPPEREGEPFSAWQAFRFAAPVLACMAFAQVLMNGGPILARGLDGSDAQVSVFSAALIFTRIPQYILSPVIGALLPRASRVLSTEGRGAFDRFVARALGVVGLVGLLMVAGTWMFGGWGLRLFAGAEFDASRAVLVALSIMATFYLLSDALNQGLFALGQGRLAPLRWVVGLLACGACLAALGVGVGERVAYSLTLGTFVVTVAQGTLYLVTRPGATGR